MSVGGTGILKPVLMGLVEFALIANLQATLLQSALHQTAGKLHFGLDINILEVIFPLVKYAYFMYLG